MQQDVQAGSSWFIRLQMARQGWISETRLQAEMPRKGAGQSFHYFCWFSRWDWHGHAVDKITVTRDASIRPDDPDAWKVMQNVVLSSARKAVLDWNTFTDQRPFVDGLQDYIESRYPLSSMRKCVPTEDIPDDIGRYADAGQPDGDATIAPLLAMARQNIEYEDDLTHHFRNFNETSNRKWGLDVRLHPKDWHGERLLPNRANLKFSSDVFLESLQAMTLQVHLGNLQALKEVYGPGQGLPPGFRALADFILEEEQSRRLKDVAYLVHAGLSEPDELEAILRSWKERWSASTTLRKRLEEPCLADVETAMVAAHQEQEAQESGFQP